MEKVVTPTGLEAAEQSSCLFGFFRLNISNSKLCFARKEKRKSKQGERKRNLTLQICANIFRSFYMLYA